MKKWWHDSTIYQIYPKSFNDTTGNGSGDLKGIIEKLDYLQNLGIDMIWMSPVFKSPMDDNGYDISDYCEIAPEFGTMEDMDTLIAEAKKRGIGIVMDLVVNHTSDEHPWFLESKKSKDNPYRDFYVWREGKDGKEPNDVKSFFSGSAWQYDETTGEYYLHLFSKKQPDLNWDNPKVREEIYKMMNFWIAKGIAGFRMDVIELIGKDIDNGIIGNTDMTHYYIQEMNRETFGDKDLFTVGETGGVTIERAKLYSNPTRNELSTIFQFQHIGLDEQPGKSKWDLRTLDFVELKRTLSKWQTELGDEAWNSLFWNNHDQPRALSRWGNDKEHRVVCAKMMATVLHGMKGTPYIYQGEEMGMTNAYFTELESYEDIETLNLYKERIEAGYKHEDIMHSLQVKGRDNSRTPMQWSKEENAGFTTGTPWLTVNANHTFINAEEVVADKDSIFYHYKKHVQLRKDEPAIVYGDYVLLDEEHPQIFAYNRIEGDTTLTVIANFTGEVVELSGTQSAAHLQGEVLSTNYGEATNYEGRTQLRPYEAVMLKVSK